MAKRKHKTTPTFKGTFSFCFAPILFLLLGNTTQAQTAHLVVRTADTLGFYLFVDQKRINSEPAREIAAKHLKAGKHVIAIHLQKGASTIESEVDLPAQTESTYQIYALKQPGEFALLPIAQVTLANPIAIAVPEEQQILDSLMSADSMQTEHTVDLYLGEKGCDLPLDEAVFLKTMHTIKSKTFEDEKSNFARIFVSTNCLWTRQVRQIMDQLEFEDNKLEFAKLAYDATFDLENYADLKNAFDFKSSKEALTEFLTTRSNFKKNDEKNSQF